MSNVNNPLSPTSYTNKDFQTIYPELLEAAKMLAKNWDPTISNESDPGVVLLKLSAIIGDKNNYNIDKNVLENYPETYTQEVSARSQYRQLGYKMPWYRAATVPVSFRWVGEELSLGQYIEIPKHTLLTDNSGEYVFTLLDKVTISKKEYNSSLTATGKVMQGMINRLSITGSDIITLAHIDSRNRLYINDHNVAENGIFVHSADDNNQYLWTQVYNVDTQSPNSKCYEFDVDQRNNSPYIQFPDDIYSTIGKGLIVEYITTDGYAGNVAANAIDSYYNESTVTVKSSDLSVEEKSIPLNTKNVVLYNTYSTSETTADLDINIGKDPETIEEARVSYKKLAGTFDTLVTLRDYMNAIYSMTPEVASNVIVTDRTDDIQCSYKIVSKYPSMFDTITYMTGEEKYVFKPGNMGDTYVKTASGFEKRAVGEGEQPYYLDVEEEKDMTPFDLKLYLLKTDGVLSTLDSYDNTFTVDEDKDGNIQRIIDINLAEMKSIQHDFASIKPDLPFMLQAVYPIKLKIIPAYKLDEIQQYQVRLNVTTALMKALNSRKCEFGEEPDYDKIYDIITKCDERIRIIIMDDFEYTLFAVYLGYKFDENGNETADKEFKYVPVSDYSTCYKAVVIDTRPDNSEIMNALLAKAVDIHNNETESKVTDYIFIDAANGVMYTAEVENKEVALKKYSDRLQELRKQIIAKNVLAGVTPLYEVKNSAFTTTIDMQQVDSQSTSSISTELEIHPFGMDAIYDPDANRKATYELKENETVRCLAPSFIMDRSFSSYTKFEMTLASPIMSTATYILADRDDEEAIVARYGYNQFYTRDNGDVYSRAISSAYLPLAANIRYKPDSYYRKINEGTGGTGHRVVSLSFYTPIEKSESAVLAAAKSSKYEFEFEKNLYYKKDGDKYIALEDYPWISDDNHWGPSYYTNCYKLRQVVTTPVYMSLNDYLVGSNIDKWETLKDKVNGRLFANEDRTDGVSVDTSTAVDGTTSPSFQDAYASLGGESYAGNNEYFVEVHEELSSLNTNSSKFVNNCSDSYIQLGYYGSDVYKVIKRNGIVVGYEMVMLNSNLTLKNFDSNGEYVKISSPDVWDIKNYEIRYFKNKIESDSDLVAAGMYFTDIVCVPNVPSTTADVYMLVGRKYEKAQINPSEWSTKYDDYYIKEEFDGIHPSSEEYLNWLNKTLNLYVPEITYRLPADTEYQLRKGDSIKFFWRDSDEDDAPYNYECYKGTDDEYSNPIIKADFTINAKSPSDERINSSNLDNSGTIGYNSAEDSDFYRIYRDMSGGEDDLGASRKVEIRKINQVRMVIDGKCKNRYYYVISNNKIKYGDKDYYTLPLEKVEMKDGKYRYKHILQPDEYFFYVNEDKTLYGALGEGTLIDYLTDTEIEGDKPMLRSVAVSAFDISFRGISVFKEHCKEISKTDDVRLIEQQVYAFTNGDTLQFNLKADFDYTYEKLADQDEFNSDTEYYTYNSEYARVELIQTSTVAHAIPPFIPNYYYKFEDEEYILQEYEPEDWKYSSNSDDGAVKYNCTDYYYKKGGEFAKVESPSPDDWDKYYIRITPEYPVISTSNPLKLDNVDIYYSTAGQEGSQSSSAGKTYTQLPAINVKDNEYKWSATAYLNINTSPTKAQKIPLADSQSRCSMTIGDFTYPSADGESTASPSKELYIMSDTTVEKTGGINIDVSWTDLLGQPRNINVFSYQINDSVSEGNGFKKQPGEDEIDYVIEKGEEGDIEITNIRLDSTCKHLLPVELMKDDLSVRIEQSQDGTDYLPAKCICCGTEELVHMSKHFIQLDSAIVSMRIHYENLSDKEDSAIKFHPIFKYDRRELFEGGKSTNNPKYGITTGDIEAKIRELDIPREFDYCHIPSKDVEILDPLEPVSVFNGSHVFNKFSIPKAELRTTLAHGSSIDFVNNR